MSSYHSSFTYNNKNSAKDKCLLITAFEQDEGLMDTFLSMDPVYEDYYDGTKRFDYGSRYNTTATIKITVIKGDGRDFSLKEVRDSLRWLTGTRVNSWLDMYVGDEIRYSFLCKCTDVQQQKMDARTIGLTITFTSVSPWAYSAEQHFDYTIEQVLAVDSAGVLYNKKDDFLGVTTDGVLYNDSNHMNNYFSVDNSVAYIDTRIVITTDNQTDDLYTYIYLDIDYTNKGSDSLSINNLTLGEETIITNMGVNEKISIVGNQFIVSNIPNKIFGEDFNFVWPRLAPGTNEFFITAPREGRVEFSYRYPMKVGDCAMDVTTYGGGTDCCDCVGESVYETIKWENVTNVPNTLAGYGITNAYTMGEIDKKISDVEDNCDNKYSAIEWDNIVNEPNTIAGYGITNVYTMEEVDKKIEEVECSCDTDINIDKEELDNMLADILG